MVKFDHIITVLVERYYTISIKRAIRAIVAGFASAGLADLLLTHSIKNATSVGLTAAGYVLLGYIQPAAKGQSFRDQVARLAKKEVNAQITDSVSSGTNIPQSESGSDDKDGLTDSLCETGDNK